MPTTGQISLSGLAAAAAFALPSAAYADDPTSGVNWALWDIPDTYSFGNTVGGGTYAPGTTGTVVDPISGETLTLTLSGEVYNTSGLNNPWETGYGLPEPYTSTVSPNSPEGSSMLAATGATAPEYQAHTLSFGQDVTNAVMGLWSLGNPDNEGELTFSQPFIVLSDNGKFTSSGDESTGYKLQGTEGNGVLQFLGTYDRLDWVITGTEIWHGFSIGMTVDENAGKDGTYQGAEVQGWTLGEPIEPYDLFASGDVVEPIQYVDPNAPIDPEPDPEPEPDTDPAPPEGTEFATLDNLDPASSQQYSWNVLINSGTDQAPVWKTTVATGTYAEYLAAVAATQGEGSDVRIEAGSLAFAGPVTSGLGEADSAQASNSLLDNILADAANLSASLSNVSQNLNNINGSIEVNTDRDYAGIAAGISALVGGYEGFGSFSTVNPNVYGVDLPGSLLAVLDPLVLELGNLSTTAIGTLQSGNMAGSFDASGIVNKVTSSAEGATTGANMLAETYGGIAQTVAMQNVSVNSGDINGSVDLILADVDAKVGSVATTAIGALQSGAMTATVDGAIGSVSHNSAALVLALVGGTGG